AGRLVRPHRHEHQRRAAAGRHRAAQRNLHQAQLTTAAPPRLAAAPAKASQLAIWDARFTCRDLRSTRRGSRRRFINAARLPDGRIDMRLALTVIAAFITLAATGGGAPAQQKITIGGTPNTGPATAMVADVEGIFQKHGLDATYTLITINPSIPP